MRAELSLVDRFFRVLVDEIREESPEYLTKDFTVAEIYQSLVPYRTHRDRIGAEMNGDYEDALLRLLAGEGGYLRLESETAQERIRLELRSSNPNTGLYREYAAVGVRLSPDRVGGADGASAREAGEDDDLDLDDLLEEVSRAVAPEADAGESAASASDSSTSGSDPAEPARAAPPKGIDGVPDGCPECGTSLPEREALRFCPFCGANVFVAPCSACGEVLERRWSFCIACGTEAS